MVVDYSRILVRFPRDMNIHDIECLGIIDSAADLMSHLQTKNIPPFRLTFDKMEVIRWMKENGWIKEE